MQTPLISNKALRRQIRIRRNSLGDKIKQLHAKTVAEHLGQLSCFQKADHIAIYAPFDGEMPTNEIAHHIWKCKKHAYLPIITPVSSQLSFAPFRQNSQYTRNQFGIVEPEYQLDELKAASNLDLVITPLIAFDQQGNRLGMGGGYYDQTFAFLKDQTFKKPLMIGLAYSFQEQIQLNAKPWDIPLFAVITEENTHYFEP